MKSEVLTNDLVKPFTAASELAEFEGLASQPDVAHPEMSMTASAEIIDLYILFGIRMVIHERDSRFFRGIGDGLMLYSGSGSATTPSLGA